MGIFDIFNKEKREEKKKFKAQLKEAKGGDVPMQLYVGQCYLNGNIVKKNVKKAANFLKLAADRSDPEAMRLYADCLHYGIGVAPDRKSAAKYYDDAAAKGNIEAQASLGGYYLLGLGGLAKDVAKGFRLIRQAYEQGSIKGTYYYGYCLENAVMVAKDVEKAAECYKQAADRGEPDACNGIASMYRNGTGVKQDLAQALSYYQKGAEGGCANAQYGYARLMEDGVAGERDYYEIAEWYQKAAKGGHAEAMACLGSLYERGLGTVFADKDTALSYYEQSAQRGCARGYDYLGSYYERNLDIQDRKSKAAKYYKMAADKGYADGIAHYGHCLRIGFGVAQDMALAKEYLQRAMKAGSAEAYCEWGSMLYLSVDYPHHLLKPEHVEVFKYYKKAADMGSARGQSALAWCYEGGMGGGIGCQQNWAEAHRLVNLAAEQGNFDGPPLICPIDIKKAAQKGFPNAECGYADYLMTTAWDEAKNPDARTKIEIEALHYYRSAAEHGNVGAMDHLVFAYMDGQYGVKRDFNKAMEYVNKMIQYGYVYGYLYLADYYGKNRHWGAAGVRDDKKAFEYLKIYVDRSDQIYEARDLGLMYLNGRGTAKNYAEAVRLLKFSYYGREKDRIYEAGYWLGLCYENGYGVQRDLAQAIELYREVAAWGESITWTVVEEANLARQALKRLGY